MAAAPAVPASITDDTPVDVGSTQTSDLVMAFTEIRRKRPLYDLLFRYYDGDQPLKYSTKRLQDAFQKIDVFFAENWLEVVVDAVLDKLGLKGWDADADANNKKLDEIWSELHLGLDAFDVHEAAVVTEEAFFIAWRNDQGTEAYFNDPRLCHMFYDPERPKEKKFAAKMWVGEGTDRRSFINLYYTDRIEHWVSRTQRPTSAKSFVPDPDSPSEPNPYDTIPVFHFRSSRRRGKRELDRALLSLQDAINKLFSDMMVAAEFTALRQKVIISQSDPGDLKSFENWWIPAGDGKSQQSSVSELGGAQLDNFLKAISDTASAMAIISRTPKHYFFAQGGDPSGDALIAMEAPLNKKVKRRQDNYSVIWQEIGAFLLLLETGEVVKPDQIKPVWEPIESIQPQSQATVLKTETDAGIPLVTAVRRRGWDKSEIDKMLKEKKEQQEQATSLAQDALSRVRARNEQDPKGSGPVVPGAPAGKTAPVK
jgi:hypothetical protein